MKLSREKRLRFGIWNDYFVSGSLVDGDWKMREGYTEEKINNFFQSTKYRTYLDEKFYPKYKKDQCDWFSGKYYYPETYKKNPMLDGEWFVKPTRGTNGDGVILTKDLTKDSLNLGRSCCVFSQSVVHHHQAILLSVMSSTIE